MKRPLVLIVRSESLRAVAVDRRRAVVWQATVEHGADVEYETSIAKLLSSAPRAIKRRPVVALIGASHAQLKTLGNLPASSDMGTLARVVAEAPRRFFAVASAAPITSSVERDDANRLWCAAFDRRVVNGVVAGVNGAHLRLEAVAPLIALVAAGVSDGTVTHVDGDAVAIATVQKNKMTCVERRVGAAESGAGNEAAIEAAPIDLDAARMVARPAPLSWRPPPSGAFGGHGFRFGLIAASSCILTLSAAGASTAGTIRIGARASRHLASLGDVPTRVAASAAELQRVTSAIDQIERFAVTRRCMTKLLRDISEALPDSTAITTLRVDSLGVFLTALSPHAADIVPALANVDGAVTPQLAGSATRESVAGARLERATFRFRFPQAMRSRGPVRKLR